MFNLELALTFSKKFFKNLTIGSSLLMISYFVFQTGVADAIKKTPNPTLANHRIFINNDNSASSSNSSSTSSSSRSSIDNNIRIRNDNFQTQYQTMTSPTYYYPTTYYQPSYYYPRVHYTDYYPRYTYYYPSSYYTPYQYSYWDSWNYYPYQQVVYYYYTY